MKVNNKGESMKRFSSHSLLVFSAIMALSISSLFAESQVLSAEGKKNLRSGNMHLVGQRYEKALPLFEEVLEENPHNIEALQYIGAINYDVKRNYFVAHDYYKKANEEIQAILDEYEELNKIDAKKAKKFYKKQIKGPKFNKSYEDNAIHMKGCWINIFKKGQSLYKAEAYDETIEKFTALLEIGPDSLKTLKMIANTYLKQEKSEKAIEYLSLIAEKDQSDISTREQIASIYFNSEKFEDSITWYEKASEIEPNSPDNYFNTAICYSKLDNDEKAFELFAKTVEVDPTNLDAIINASNKAAAIENSPEQIKYLKMAIEIDAENATYISFLCYKLVKEKQYEELLKYSSKWLELVPDSDEAKQLNSFVEQQLKQ